MKTWSLGYGKAKIKAKAIYSKLAEFNAQLLAASMFLLPVKDLII